MCIIWLSLHKKKCENIQRLLLSVIRCSTLSNTLFLLCIPRNGHMNHEFVSNPKSDLGFKLICSNSFRFQAVEPATSTNRCLTAGTRERREEKGEIPISEFAMCRDYKFSGHVPRPLKLSDFTPVLFCSFFLWPLTIDKLDSNHGADRLQVRRMDGTW